MVIIVGVRHVIRVTVGLLVAFSLSIPFVGVAVAVPARDAFVDLAVIVTNGQLTVDVRNAPLARVLGLIGDLAGVEVTLHGDLRAAVTEAFAGLPLEEGIRRLARGHSVVISYGAPTGESGSAMVSGFRVMAAASPAGRSSDAPLSFDGKSSRGATSSSPGVVSEPPVDGRTSGVTGDAPLDFRVVEIQRFADDAGLGSEAAMGRLIEVAASETDTSLREQAVAALGRLTGPATEPALVSALADTAAEVRLRAIRGLRRLGTDTSAESIAEASLADRDPQVRLAAITALTSLPGAAMRRALVKASSDPDDVVRQAAIQGLAWWTTRGPVTP